MMAGSRREFLAAAIALWQAASLRAQQQRQATFVTPQHGGTLLFLDIPRRDVLRRLMDCVVPADERSAGAVGAHVDEYIDFVLFHADSKLQDIWRRGLDRYGEAIQSENAAGIDAFLARQARSEFSPQTEEEQFFVYLKTAITEGFYTSEEGISRELGYKGMSFELDFPGCTHKEHKVPAGYKPLLRSAEKA
jgi:Gluconate 2-dehydrogenase subunit 3